MIAHAGFDSLLDPVLSAHTVQRYKTDQAAYALGPQALELPARDILFVSSNGWDAIGATWYGYTTLWVNRSQLPLEHWTPSPRAPAAACATCSPSSHLARFPSSRP